MPAEHNLRGDALWSAGGRGLAAGLNLVALVVYSRLLGPEGFGLFALCQAVAVIVHNGAFHWLEAAILRFVPAANGLSAALRRCLLTGYVLAVLVVGLLALVAAVVAGAGISGVPVPSELVLPVLLMVLGEAGANGMAELQRASGRMRRYALLVLSRAALTILFALLIYANRDMSPAGIILGHALGCLLTAAAGWFLCRGLKAVSGSPMTLRSIGAFGLPLSVSLLIRLAAQRLDRFLVAALLGLEAAGLYALAMETARRAVGVPLSLVSLATYPRLAAARDRPDEEERLRIVRLNGRALMLAGLPLSIGLAAVAPTAFPLVFGPEWGGQRMTLVASLSALAVLFEALRVQHADYAFMLARRTAQLVVLSLVGLVLLAVLLPLLISVSGPVGAAFAVQLVMALMLAVSLHAGMRYCPMPLDLRQALAVTFCCLPMAVLVVAIGWTGQGAGVLALQILAGGGFFLIWASMIRSTGFREFVGGLR